MAASRVALNDRVAALQVRLDALKRGKAASVPGQLGLDFTAPAAAPAGKGKAPGVACGESFISAADKCRKGEGGGIKEPSVAPGPGFQQLNGRRLLERQIDIWKQKIAADPESDRTRLRAESEIRKLESQLEAMGKPQALSPDRAAMVAKQEKSIKEVEAVQKRQKTKGMDPDEIEVTEGDLEGMRMAKEIMAGRLSPRAEMEKWKAQGLLSNTGAAPAAHTPRRFGATPRPRKPEEEMLTSSQVLSGASQEKFAKQQRAAAWRAGDKEGEKAWAEQQAEIQRRRLAASRSKLGMSQQGLFGVTEYASDMPLFGRTDAAQSSYLVQRVVAGVLHGAQVLDWDQQRGITSGRAAAEGLVYRFRCDAAEVVFSPAWDGLTEESWENRSTGFLALRDPSMRVDFKKLKFGQAKSKRKCAKGYSCGSSCISLAKECRITPKDALGKQRLRQLRALAMSGDPAAKERATAVEQARLQKAFEKREARDVGKIKKLMVKPEMQEYLRTGRLPAAGGPAAGAEPEGGSLAGKVKVVDPKTVEVDAERFQYKIAHSSTGEVGSLKGVKKWDDNLAGVISVWQDPKDSKTYVINGHNRLGLAKRMGVEEVTVRYLKAGSAQEARAIGAMQNIAEGQGSELDAAKFFRDSGIRDQAGVEEKGLPLSSGKAAKGLALSKLPKEMFQEVIQGDITPARGAIIGGSGLDEGKQREIGKLLRQRKNLSDGTLQEYVDNLAVSQRQTQGTLDLLGPGEESVDNGLARAELSNGLRRKLAKEKSLFATVSKSRAAEALQQKAGNVINQSESAEVASEADQVLRVFKLLKDQSGPVANALNKAATRVTKGESAAAVRKELEEEVIAAMQEELERAGLRKKKATANEAPTGSLFDSLIARIIRLDARIKQSPGQLGFDLTGGGEPAGKGKTPGIPCGESHISAAKECRKGEGGGGVNQPAAQGKASGGTSSAPPAQPGNTAPGINPGSGFLGTIAISRKKAATPPGGESWGPVPTPKAAPAAPAAAAGPKPFASPDDLSFELAMRAHSGTSFSPEDRARSHQKDFANHLNSVHEKMSALAVTPAQKEILEKEMATYKEGYKARYNAWLGAKSRIISPMISGPANFPVRRMEKANASVHKRNEELIAFSKKGQAGIQKKLRAAADPFVTMAENSREQEVMISRSLRNIDLIDRGAEGFRGFDRRLLAGNLAARIGRMAARGEVEAVTAALDQINVDQRSMKKPAFTPRHSIWELSNVAAQARRKAAAAKVAPTDAPKMPEFKSGSMERDYDAERVRIQFNDGKPSNEIRGMLKSSGWRWSPTNTAWQRMNTENSVYSARRILEAADKEREGRGDSLEARLQALQERMVAA